MDIKLNILAPIFKEPRKSFLIRELARKTRINPATMRKFVYYYVRQGVLRRVKSTPYDHFTANMESRAYLNLKIYNNLDILTSTGLLEALEKWYEYPPIVLFGSFSKGTDDEDSDIDLCIVSDIPKSFDASSFQAPLSRKISIHQFTKNAWKRLKEKNAGLVNSIANGITLSGQIEVLP